MVVSGDVVVFLSNSGETEEVVRLLELVRRLGCRVLALTGNPRSTLARHADVHIDVAVAEEACPLDLVPTASTTAAMALGDALAVCCYEAKGFTAEDFVRYHPGGRLGRKLLAVRDLMHSGDEIPTVPETADMRATVAEISRKKLGMTCVVAADGRLVGVITDGDLRRRMLSRPDPTAGTAADAMVRTPQTIGPAALASEALQKMEERKITSLPVVAEDGKLEGVIQIHDLWRTQLF
jgi:arabinose-5-phosphate isomerase